MFDIGFLEIVLLGVVGLLVLGPEKLPHAARMTGAFIGKVRRSVVQIQSQIEAEVDAAEMRERIKQQMEKTGLNDLRDEINAGVNDIESSAAELDDDVEKHSLSESSDTTNKAQQLEQAKAEKQSKQDT